MMKNKMYHALLIACIIMRYDRLKYGTKTVKNWMALYIRIYRENKLKNPKLCLNKVTYISKNNVL